MAAKNHVETTEPGADDQACCDPAATVSVLDDDTAVELFQAIAEPTAVSALAETCDLPLSTAYRKIHELEHAGLLDTEGSSSSGDSQATRYERAVDSVTVTLGDDLSVTCVPADD